MYFLIFAFVVAFYIKFANQNMKCGDRFCEKLYSNDILFFIRDMEDFFKGFILKFILFHCSGWNKI